MDRNLLITTFLLGCLVLACATAGVFFIRFWRRTNDRLFAMFATAFWLMGLNWLLLAFVQTDEPRSWLYVIRLIAFIIMLIAIIDKNRQPPH